MENIDIEKNKYLEKYKEKFFNAGFFVEIKDSLVKINKEDFVIEGNSSNTFWTAEGVLCSKEYDFYSNDDYIMVDIGLNIGITSLYFAQNQNIKKIYGFEPFVETFKQAQNNLKNNPRLSEKIEIFNFGIGDRDELLNISYNKDLPGAMSTSIDRYKNLGQNQEIKVFKASSIFGEIFKKHTEKFFFKIDCEGSEFDILKELNNSGLIKKIDVLCLEWHFKNPKEIIDILQRNNFVVFNKEIIKDEIGFIRAVKL